MLSELPLLNYKFIKNMRQTSFYSNSLYMKWFLVTSLIFAVHLTLSCIVDAYNSLVTVAYFTTGGYLCMTARNNPDSSEVKAALECVLKQMEQEGLLTCVKVTEEKEWHRLLGEHEDGYESGVVYLYKKP